MLTNTSPSSNRARDASMGRYMVRLVDAVTGEYLHLSGKGTTKTLGYAWLGFRHQAETLQTRATARGEAWPFTPLHRDLCDPITPMKGTHDGISL